MSLMQRVAAADCDVDDAHVAMRPWNHKITQKDMERMLVDTYEEEGGNLLSFLQMCIWRYSW